MLITQALEYFVKNLYDNLKQVPAEINLLDDQSKILICKPTMTCCFLKN